MIDVEFMKLFWPMAAIHPGPKGTWLSAAGSKSSWAPKAKQWAFRCVRLISFSLFDTNAHLTPLNRLDTMLMLMPEISTQRSTWDVCTNLDTV